MTEFVTITNEEGKIILQEKALKKRTDKIQFSLALSAANHDKILFHKLEGNFLPKLKAKICWSNI